MLTQSGELAILQAIHERYNLQLRIHEVKSLNLLDGQKPNDIARSAEVSHILPTQAHRREVSWTSLTNSGSAWFWPASSYEAGVTLHLITRPSNDPPGKFHNKPQLSIQATIAMECPSSYIFRAGEIHTNDIDLS